MYIPILQTGCVASLHTHITSVLASLHVHITSVFHTLEEVTEICPPGPGSYAYVFLTVTVIFTCAVGNSINYYV